MESSSSVRCRSASFRSPFSRARKYATSAATDSDTYITSKQNVIPKVAFTGRRPPLHLDPPEHTPYRKALNPLLSLERSERFAPKARELARMLREDHIDAVLLTPV